METLMQSIKDEELKKQLKFIFGLLEINDKFVISGSLSQFLHLKKVHRKVTDIDLVAPDFLMLPLILDDINNNIGTNYKLSSFYDYQNGGYHLKMGDSIKDGLKTIKTYTSIDVKYHDEPYTTTDKNLKIIIFEKLLCNKIATTLIGDNKNHYIRIKDFYDLNFLLKSKEFDYDLMTYYLCKRLSNHGIDDVFKTFLFKDKSDELYERFFVQQKGKYEMNEKVNLLLVKDFLIENGSDINKKLIKTK